MKLVKEMRPIYYFEDGDFKYPFYDLMNEIESLHGTDGFSHVRIADWGEDKLWKYLEDKGIARQTTRGGWYCCDEDKRYIFEAQLYSLREIEASYEQGNDETSC